MKKYDIYGNRFQLHFSGDYTISTKFGGFLSIITIILMIIYIFFDGCDIFLRKDPRTYQENQTLNVSHALNFTNSEFRFYFNLFYGSNRSSFDDPSYLKVKLISKLRKNNNILQKDFNLKKCTNKNFQNVKPTDNLLIFRRLVENNYYCPDFNNFTLSGSWVEDLIESAQIQIYPCNNKTDKINCKSFDQINDFVLKNKIYLSLYYPLSVVKLDDYQNPISYNLKEDYFYIRDFTKYSFYYYDFDKILLTTDSGILYTSESDMEGVSMKLITNDERILNSDDPYIFSIDFYSSFNLIKYKRSYVKILDIFADFGGMMQIVTIFFQMIVSVFHTLHRIQFMTDKLFIFEDPFKIKNKHDEDFILKKLIYHQEKIRESQAIGISNGERNKSQSNIKIPEIEQSNINTTLDHKKQMLTYIRNHFASKGKLMNKRLFKNMVQEINDGNLNKEPDTILNKSKQEIQMNDLKISTTLANNNNTKTEIHKNLLNNEEKTEYENPELNLNQPINLNKTNLDYTYISKNKFIKTEFDNSYDIKVADTINIQNNNSQINLNLFRESDRQNLKINNPIEKNPKKLNQYYTENMNLNLDLKNNPNNNKNEDTINYNLTNTRIQLNSDNNQFIDFGEEARKKVFFIKKLLKKKKSDTLILNFSQMFTYIFKSFMNLKSIKNNKEIKFLLLMDQIDKKIESYFDILKIIKIVEETNLLKHILMTNQHKLLIELIRKDYISINDIDHSETSRLKNSEEKKSIIQFNDHHIIEAVINLFYSDENNICNKTSDTLKINKHFIEILEEKILL